MTQSNKLGSGRTPSRRNSLWTESGRWRFLPLGFFFCALEWFLMGINLIYDAEIVFGIVFTILGIVCMAISLNIFYAKEPPTQAP